MSKERELLQNILDQHEDDRFDIGSINHGKIRRLLAQPEQSNEPVAWMYDWKTPSKEVQNVFRSKNHLTTDIGYVLNEVENVRPLYLAPPTHLISAAPELLEALENWINALDDPSEWMKCRDDAKKAIAKAHGITGVDDKKRELLERWVMQNSFAEYYALREETVTFLAQPEQYNEPVAWRGINFTEAEGDWLYRDIDEPFTDSNYRSVGEALYLAPPRHEPLSDSAICYLYYKVNGEIDKFVRAIEKAHGIGE